MGLPALILRSLQCQVQYHAPREPSINTHEQFEGEKHCTLNVVVIIANSFLFTYVFRSLISWRKSSSLIKSYRYFLFFRWIKYSNTTGRLHFHFSLSCIGEGHGNPLQCSCLENPRDGGAWWAAIYGFTQTRTRLKRLSSKVDSKVKVLIEIKRIIFK